MLPIWIVGRMTFLEARRNRVTWSLLFFCLVLVLTSFMFQEVTIAAFDRVVRDVGLGAISLFGVLLSIFLGVGVVTREIERRTVFALLAKPLTRNQYLLGKLVGVWATIVVCLSLMLGAFLIELLLYRGAVAPVVFEAFWLMLIEFLLLASFAILASTFTSSLMAAFMTIALYIIGHSAEDLYFAGRRSSSHLVHTISSALFYMLPNLEKLNLKSQASSLTAVPFSHVVASTAYGLLYAATFIVLGMAIFSRRDMK